jgi:hypothetical protein
MFKILASAPDVGCCYALDGSSPGPDDGYANVGGDDDWALPLSGSGPAHDGGGGRGEEGTTSHVTRDSGRLTCLLVGSERMMLRAEEGIWSAAVGSIQLSRGCKTTSIL